ATRSGPIRLGKLRGVVELPKHGDLAVADREDVHPIAGDGASGLADLPDVVAENEHAVFGGEELAQREINRFLMLRDALEEFLDLTRPLPASQQRIVRAAAVDGPIDVRCQGLDDRCDVASAKGAIEALDEADIGGVHRSLLRVSVPADASESDRWLRGLIDFSAGESLTAGSG